MIISHKYRCIFIAIPKTGTHSVREALRSFLGEDDEEQVFLRNKSVVNNKELAKMKHGHISCKEAETHLDKKVWSEYFKFTFVRNPYDRFISASFFHYRDHPILVKHPNLHLKNILLFPDPKTELWFRNQVDFMTGTKDKIKIDFIGKTESMQEDFNTISDLIGLPKTKLKVTNQSVHHDYSTYYDAGLEEMVYQKYKRDFDVLKYEKGLNNK